MNNFYLSLTQSIGMLFGLIVLGVILRRLSILKEEHAGVFARLITDCTLPAIIFCALARHPMNADRFLLTGAMIGAETICILVAYSAATLFRLPPRQKGVMIIASAFGSSAFIGYAVIKEVFSGSGVAISDAVTISELGVGSLIFTVGVLISIHYGKTHVSVSEKMTEMLRFFYSPVFLSIVLGLTFSILPVLHNTVITSMLYKFLGIVGSANTLLVTLTIGITLHFKHLRKMLPVLFTVCLIKLILQPFLAYVPAAVFHFQELWKEILILEAAMPTAALTVVFARKYGGDSEFASLCVCVTLVLSLVTTLSVVFFLA